MKKDKSLTQRAQRKLTEGMESLVASLTLWSDRVERTLRCENSFG
jgi:hypothetical protein